MYLQHSSFQAMSLLLSSINSHSNDFKLQKKSFIIRRFSILFSHGECFFTPKYSTRYLNKRHRRRVLDPQHPCQVEVEQLALRVLGVLVVPDAGGATVGQGEAHVGGSAALTLQKYIYIFRCVHLNQSMK